jgi:beta-glucosidase
LTIDPAATSHPLGIFDAGAQQWKTVDGAYSVYVGNSSANITLTDSIVVRTPGRH